ncbi:MAG: DUF4258 domain-containing protein [Oligoflexia bacterium]|nr:DUF4258 domain-containing protein [Oligoflexia bacterium]
MRGKLKPKNLLVVVKAKVEAGQLRFSQHALDRMKSREITRLEVEQVLKEGRHNKKKDQFNELERSWDFVIEGKTIDKRLLRIVVAVIEPNLLVVTAIDLKSGD